MKRNREVEDIPQWEKDIIDERLQFIKNHPERLISLEDFIIELDINDESRGA